jgi:hypothetical protein
LHEGREEQRARPALEEHFGRQTDAGAGTKEDEVRGAAPHFPSAAGPARSRINERSLECFPSAADVVMGLVLDMPMPTPSKPRLPWLERMPRDRLTKEDL